ncbi:disease resistance protein RPV1-like [Vicia villosa]|uniref:disease resistance protein RPV1-like n=1 Tax=Vicia villosa TaxID=3911 RepID=UPI00273C9E70|nr:disease resistance protein RPV1-like [Vicia villosa]
MTSFLRADSGHKRTSRPFPSRSRSRPFSSRSRSDTRNAIHFQEQFFRDEEIKSEQEDMRKTPLKIYEVFLSFRGEDTRSSFISHLYASLQNAGINVFKDDDSLKRGNDISASLLRAIEGSQIALIVFSTNYANSQWCLDELVKIMECHGTLSQVVVLPVFYDVDPSDVRHQTGEFGKAFHSLLKRISKKEGLYRKVANAFKNVVSCLLKSKDESPSRVQRWKEALGQAAGLAGFVVLNSRNQSEVIKEIVEKTTLLLDKTDMFVANHPVGVEPRVHDMIQLLDIQPSIQQSSDVLLIGMWGMGGMGKTTIAKAIYNKIGRCFEGRSFLANIREVWEQNVGQVSLQEQILFDIYKETTTGIQNTDQGKSILKDKLCHKRVFLVLDDVNTLDQLNALCGDRQWFGSGSRIIITTRNMDLLKGNRVDKFYNMQEMDERETIELLSWHAFKQVKPKEVFIEISKNVVEYAGRLPLALEVLGSYLYGREVKEWECVLDKLKTIPNDQIQKKLRISYDGLEDDTQKDILLDIACFFIGKDRNDVIHILNECELYPENGINILVARSLVTVDDTNKLRMHDLLRDMGREITRENSLKNPEKHSRLWFNKDVLEVLSKRTGTKVEGLALMLPRASTECFSTKAFEKMTRLRLLQLDGVKLNDDFEYLSKNLRWLSWNGFPLTSIPTSFYLRNLVSIELENSKIKYLWNDKQTQSLEKLKILNLSHSHYLTKTPDFSKLPNLEQLILIDCPRLSEVSDTFEYNKKVLLINLEDCISLQSLPRSLYKLKSLKTLIISGCSKIDKLEEDLEQLESLTTLIANNTAITKVPFSLEKLQKIGYISLCGYEGFPSDVFPSIIKSWTSPRNNLSSIVPLNAPRSSSLELSSMFEYLPQCQCLWVKCDSKVDLSRSAKIILNALSVTDSEEMEQVHISGSETSFKPRFFQTGVNCEVTESLKEEILQGKGGSHPYCFNFNCDGSSVKFEVPIVLGRNLNTIMCVVYPSTPDNITSDDPIKSVLVINYTKATFMLFKTEALASFEDEELQSAISSIQIGNKVEFVVVSESNFAVKSTRIYLIYDGPIHKELGFIKFSLIT